MDGIKIDVTGNIAKVIEKPRRITSGTIGLPVEFTFDDQWDYLQKMAVFCAGAIKIPAELNESIAVVPWEVLVHEGYMLSIGVFGANEDGTTAIPTIWTNVSVIQIGAVPDGAYPAKPTPPVWQRIENEVYRIGEVVDVVNEKYENTKEQLNKLESAQQGLSSRVEELEAVELVDIENLSTTIYKTSGTTVEEGSSPNYLGQKIKVSAGDIFIVTGYGSTSYKRWAFTDNNGSILSRAMGDYKVVENEEITAPEDADWLYVAFHKDYEHSLHQQKRAIPASKEETNRKINEIAKANVLYGKKYIAAGDSYTAWSDASYPDGIYAGQNVTYDREIRLRNGMTGDNAGLSGSTMTYKSGESVRSFSEGRYLEIPQDTDYLTIAFGINDSASRSIGNLGNTENTTFYGAWDKVLKYYAINRPDMKIGIICFLRQGQDETHRAIKEIAKHYGVPLLDFYSGEDAPVYIDGVDNGIEGSVANIKRKYWSGHDNVDKNTGKPIKTEEFRGKTYNLIQPSETESYASHPGYRAHIDESTVIEEFLRRL